MSSVTMSKAEAVILFDMIGVSSIPVGINDLPDVDEREYQRIIGNFIASKMITSSHEKFRVNKGLEQFFLPMVNAETIIIFNCGVGNEPTFNASLYFAKGGLVALLDNRDDSIKFLTLSDMEELLLFIPDISAVGTITGNGIEPYISYVLLLNNGVSILHCTQINSLEGTAKVLEGKRIPNAEPIEATGVVSILEYREMLHGKMREVYNAVSC